ncbi:MAG: hypothetical protein JAZ15_21890 [Candidatus Thiodiazotropha endolucinida]|nr:hypothetical protein [Candidatus Thiodiazotropha taylori]MCW4315669.1 hypothetical protein [Candidatus Thiodiazotropha taylori]
MTKKLHIDARSFDIALPETEVTLTELFMHGTKDEVIEALQICGMLIKDRKPLPPELGQIVGDAFMNLDIEQDPIKALSNQLGLTRKKKHGVRYQKTVTYLINNLMDQGLTKSEALSIAGRFDPKTNELIDDPADAAARRIKERLSVKT